MKKVQRTSQPSAPSVLNNKNKNIKIINMITKHFMAKAMQLVSERVSLPTWAL